MQNAPVVQRTNGVVVPPAGSASGPDRSSLWAASRPALVGALAGATRHDSRTTFTPSRVAGFQLGPGAGPRLCTPLGRYSFRSAPWPGSVSHNAGAEPLERRRS